MSLYLAIGSLLLAGVGTLAAVLVVPEPGKTWLLYLVFVLGPAGLLVGAVEFGIWLERKRGPVGELRAEIESLKGLQVAAENARREQELATRRDAAHRLVQHLHLRWFRGNGLQLDERYRVSMFVPSPDPVTIQKWVCLARTVEKRPPAEWDHVNDHEELDHAGVVVNVARQNAPLWVPGVPASKRDQSDEHRQYFKRSYVTEDTHEQRTWGFASIFATIARAGNGTIMCILVVERKDGDAIEIHPASPALRKPEPSPIDLCGQELQLAADVWTKAWDAER